MEFFDGNVEFFCLFVVEVIWFVEGILFIGGGGIMLVCKMLFFWFLFENSCFLEDVIFVEGEGGVILDDIELIFWLLFRGIDIFIEGCGVIFEKDLGCFIEEDLFFVIGIMFIFLCDLLIFEFKILLDVFVWGVFWVFEKLKLLNEGGGGGILVCFLECFVLKNGGGCIILWSLWGDKWEF